MKTMPGVEVADFIEVIDRFDKWRTIAISLGLRPYDAPDFENGRLYFRSDYTEQVSKWPPAREQGDWGAYIIETTPTGFFCVVRSLWHERAPQRTERPEALFSRAEDAGKYVIAQAADEIHVGLRLESQFLKWEAQGLGPSIDIETPSDDDLQEFIKRIPGITVSSARQHRTKYKLVGHPEVFAVTSSGNGPYMHVLTLSFDQLDSQLANGLPQIT